MALLLVALLAVVALVTNRSTGEDTAEATPIMRATATPLTATTPAQAAPLPTEPAPPPPVPTRSVAESQQPNIEGPFPLVRAPQPTAQTGTGYRGVGSATWALDLLETLITNDRGAPESHPYERDDYDGWLDLDGDCQSARHEVLAEESLIPVTWTNAAGCKVEQGHWLDPYTGHEVFKASDASIDHVVAVSESHHDGAWEWSTEWKRALFNDIADPATLTVAAVASNGAKGSAGADQWLPGDPDDRCRYVVARVRVRARWGLSVTSAERTALESALAICHEAGLPASPEDTPLALIDFSAEAPAPPPTPTPQILVPGCDDRYQHVCVPVAAGDLNCPDIAPRRFAVTGEDPHRFDGNNDGVGCEMP